MARVHARKQKGVTLQESRRNFLRIFVVESPDPLDAMQGRSEGPVVEAIGRLIGHEVLSFLARSRAELKQTCRYIASIDPEHDSLNEATRALCLHISAHGNKSGLQVGGDDLNWDELVWAIQPFIERDLQYAGDRIVVLSACAADQQQLSTKIQKQVKTGGRISPPKYLFCTPGDIAWQDAAVGWTLFYHLLPELDLDNRKQVQSALKKISMAGVGNFVYSRWDDREEGYRRYSSK